MDDNESGRREVDRFLVLEAALGLVLFGLAIYLYWIPASRAPFIPQWWSLPVLGGLFFAIVWLDHRRRKNRSQRDLKEAVRDVSDEARRQGRVTSAPQGRVREERVTPAEEEVIRPDEPRR